MRTFDPASVGALGRLNEERIDPVRAAELEVRWWRVHRELQRERPGDDDAPLVDAIADLYRYVYQVDSAAVHGPWE